MRTWLTTCLIAWAVNAGAVSIDRLSGDVEPGLPVRIVAASNTVTIGSLVDPSTGTTGAYGQVAISSTSATIILAASTTRMSNPTVCNETNIQVGVGYDVSVTTSNAHVLDEGQCWWPEGPSVYRGAVYGMASAAGCTVSYDVTTK